MKKMDCRSVALCNRSLLLTLASLCFLFTTANAQFGPYSVFDHTPITGDGPAGGTGGVEANRQDGQSIESGVKFRVYQSGVINGVLYYQGTSNTGTHTAQFWDLTAGGPALASATSSTVAPGWVEIDFATPVAVLPGNIYAATVFMPTGFYASTGGYYSGNVVANSIEFLCDCDPASPNNGVYDYTASPLTVPPVSHFGGANYWIDVSITLNFAVPVGLLDFKAATTNKDVVVSWKTASESNNRGFEIERSNNSVDWYPVTFINGSGESSTTRSYSFTDRALAPGSYYYRLKQVDFDGKNKTSTVVTAAVAGKGQVSLFQNYPNPFTTSTAIRFDLPRAQYAKLSLLDISGREVRVLTDKLTEAGSHLVTLDASTLMPQFYIVRLQTDEGILTKKILVQ